MGLFDSYKKGEKKAGFEEKRVFHENPIEEYDVSALVDEIYAAQDSLDDKVHDFLGRVHTDPRIAGNFNVNEEWRCWLERDCDGSKILFDSELTGLDEEAAACFKECYSAERKALLADLAAVDKMAQPIDEYKLFKAYLFNVFNNAKDLPLNLYMEQVFSRAKDYGMTITRHSKEDVDLMVAFDPLGKINRGDAFFAYDLYMRFNHGYKKECYMFSVSMMDAASSEAMYSGPVCLPVYNPFSKFSKETDAYFLSSEVTIFSQQALKAHRRKEKERFGIPADYFEGSFIDQKKLVDFSEKSYQYGNSKIFIPKSQIAFAGDKVYMKRWLYAKLKRPVEQYEAKQQVEKQASLDDKVASAAAQAADSEARKAEQYPAKGQPLKENEPR